MIDFRAILLIIAKHVQKHLGEQTLNELIAQGIAVYLEIIKVLPASRSIGKPAANPDIVIDVLEDLSEMEV